MEKEIDNGTFGGKQHEAREQGVQSRKQDVQSREQGVQSRAQGVQIKEREQPDQRGQAGSLSRHNNTRHHKGRVLLLLLIATAALILLFVIRRAVLNNRDYRAVADFSEAMQHYDLDAMKSCWNTSFLSEDSENSSKNKETDDFSGDEESEDTSDHVESSHQVELENIDLMSEVGEENKGGWNSWSDLKEAVTPYMADDDLNRKLKKNASHITCDVEEKQRLSNGMYYVEVEYSYYAIDEISCKDGYHDWLVGNNIDHVDLDSDQMGQVLDLWYQTIKDIEPDSEPSVDYNGSEVKFLIKDGKILAYQNNAGESYHPLENAMLAVFPAIKENAEEEARDTLETREYMAKKNAELQKEMEAAEAWRNSANTKATPGSDASSNGTTGGSDSSGRTAYGYSPDPSYVPHSSGNSKSRSNSKNSYNNEENADTIDPDDHDIEGYYEDHRDEYEDEDDAYDGFLDDEDAWEDY